APDVPPCRPLLRPPHLPPDLRSGAADDRGGIVEGGRSPDVGARAVGHAGHQPAHGGEGLRRARARGAGGDAPGSGGVRGAGGGAGARAVRGAGGGASGRGTVRAGGGAGGADRPRGLPAGDGVLAAGRAREEGQERSERMTDTAFSFESVTKRWKAVEAL